MIFLYDQINAHASTLPISGVLKSKIDCENIGKSELSSINNDSSSIKITSAILTEATTDRPESCKITGINLFRLYEPRQIPMRLVSNFDMFVYNSQSVNL